MKHILLSILIFITLAASSQTRIPQAGIAPGIGTKAVRYDPTTKRFYYTDTTTGGGGYTNLTQFVAQNNWKTFYSNGSGDVTELAIGSSGKVLTSNGTSSAPSWETPATGNVTKVGTPVNNQLGVWTGDGTIKGDANLTWDGSNLQIGGFADLTVTGNIYAASTLGRFGWIEVMEAGAFGSVLPGAGVIWVKNDGTLHFKNDANVDIELGSGGSSSIATLTDVTLTSLATNDFLKYNGSAWVNRTPANVRTDLSLVVGTNVQAYDADLDTWAGKTPYAGTLTITTGKTADIKKSLTLDGTDGTTMTFPSTSASIARTDAAQTFTGVQTFSSAPVIGSITNTGTLTLPTVTGTVVQKKVTTITSNATWSPAGDASVNIYEITQQAVAVTTISAPSGSPSDGNELYIMVLDNGTARGISGFDAIYRFSTSLAAPTTTTLGKQMKMKFIYTTINGANKWDCVSIIDGY